MSSRSHKNRLRSRLEALEDRQLLAAAIPIFHSNPGASRTLYLDFDGHYEEDYGSHDEVRTPAMNFDGRPDQLSVREWSLIQDVWRGVAEDFAPFDIDVTTERPEHMRDGREMRIAIGGHWRDWLGDPSSGICTEDTFTGDEPNVAYVFSEITGANALSMATTVSHEAGHAFGLEHQSDYDAAGRKIDEYSMGGTDWTPIMGANLSTDRTIWWQGTSSVNFSNFWFPDGGPGLEIRGDRAILIQDDMFVLGRNLGWRADDHGNETSAATRLGTLTWSGGLPARATATGVIGRTTDADYFTFRVGRHGTFRADLDALAQGANLDARLELRQMAADGEWELARAAPADDLGAVIERWLEPGDYALVVRSEGGYGDVGHYTLGLSLQRDVAAPAVTNVVLPTGMFDRRTMRIFFSEAISLSTFTSDDVRIVAPDGTRVPVTIVSNAYRRVFSVRVPWLTQVGRYRVEIGPNLRDPSGNAMNQDGDRVYGQAVEDVFVASFYIPPPAPAHEPPPLPGGAPPPRHLFDLARAHWDLQTVADLHRNGPPPQLVPTQPITDQVQVPAGLSPSLLSPSRPGPADNPLTSREPNLAAGWTGC